MKRGPTSSGEQRIDKSSSEASEVLKEKLRDAFIGRTLDNKYELEGILGRGGMGSVYLARRRQLGDMVAVKILTIDKDLNPTDLRRFQLEAATAASIKHNNVIGVHDFGLLDDIAYLV